MMLLHAEDDIARRIERGQRITTNDAKWLFTHASDEELQRLATHVRSRFHKPDHATYLIMAIINYTNVCVAKCDYCAFYRLPKASDTYLLSPEEVSTRIDRLLAAGGTMVAFNGGFHPKLRIEDYANLFRHIRQRHGQRLEFYGMTVAELMFACKVSKMSYADGAAQLAASGIRWITGGGAEILDNNFRRRHSPLKYTVEDYYRAQRAILDAGLGSTATMVIGFDESLDERMNHLETLREFQDVVDGALASFLCWTYKPYNTPVGGHEISTREYLRWLAVCRIYLDNFVHIRTSVLTQNAEALRGLSFGADDFDLPTEDEVTEMAGATISTNFEAILQTAKSLGFDPTYREPLPLRPSTRPAPLSLDPRPSGRGTPVHQVP
jgi:cyclic dehypoxanthinyl futalosine synthase